MVNYRKVGRSVQFQCFSSSFFCFRRKGKDIQNTDEKKKVVIGFPFVQKSERGHKTESNIQTMLLLKPSISFQTRDLGRADLYDGGVNV